MADAPEKVRLNLQISSDLNDILEDIAASSASTKSEVIRQALALMQIAHAVKKKGRHLGWVVDADRLDTEIVGLL